jgi:hypothetical protein
MQGLEREETEHHQRGQKVYPSPIINLSAHTNDNLPFRLAEYLESEPERLAAKAEAQKAKLEALERKLGIEPSSAAGPSRTPAVGSGEPARPSSIDVAPLAGKKHRFDDTEYLEQSRELTENVKSAVSAGVYIVPWHRFSTHPFSAQLFSKRKRKPNCHTPRPPLC